MWCHPSTGIGLRRSLLFVALGLLFVALTTTLFLANVSLAAQNTTKTVNFQGRLQTSTGAVVPDGHYNMQFKIYQGGTGTAEGNPGGSDEWTETYINNGGTSGVEVKNGFFSVSLGSVNQFGTSVDWDQDTLFLSMNVAGSASACTTFGTAPCTADGEMLPMKRITATPYAINAGAVGGKTLDQLIQNTATLQTGNIALQSASGSSVGLSVQGASGQTEDIFQVKANGVTNPLLSMSAGGALTLRNTTDSSGALQVHNAAGATLLNVDTAANHMTLLGNNSGEPAAWSTASNSLPAGLSDFSSVTANGYIYALGGGSGVYYAKLNANGSVGTWTTSSNSLPAGRWGATAVTANGYVYVIGGAGPNNTTYYAKLATDGSVGTWKQANTLPAARGDHTSVVANGHVYVIGGLNGSVQQSVYYATLNADGSLGEWQTEGTNTLPTNGRYRAVSAYANGYLYIIGGPNGADDLSYAKLNSNGSVGTWTNLGTSLPVSREDATSVISNGYIYVMGGTTNGISGTNTVYYAKLNSDGSVGTWATAANTLPAARCRSASIMANGYAYVIGGNPGGSSDCGNTTSTSTVFYSRIGGVVQVGGSLDLVGLQGQNLAEGGSGGQLTAGNTTVVGTFQVQDSANFAQGVTIDGTLNVNDSAVISTDSADAFQVQNSAGESMFRVSTDGTPKIQIGDGSSSGAPTLLTLDKASSAPEGSEALLGSMYYDVTLGKVQCYEADGWGACGSSPDTFITLSPEYSNTVTNGSGIGTMTTDLCSDTLDINDGSSGQPTICGTNETYNFYNWTSAQGTAQTKSLYVTYKLPSTFKAFTAGSTSLMGRTDHANSTVTYQAYRNRSSGLTACGSAVAVSTGSQSAWQTAAAGGSSDPSACSFAAGDSIVFKINLTSASNANAYIANLNFTFSNN